MRNEATNINIVIGTGAGTVAANSGGYQFASQSTIEATLPTSNAGTLPSLHCEVPFSLCLCSKIKRVSGEGISLTGMCLWIQRPQTVSIQGLRV